MVPVQAILTQAAGAQPSVSSASEAYVLISSPAEVETIDTTTGTEIGAPTSLGTQTPTALAEWYSAGSAPSQIVVVGSGCLSEFTPGAGSSGGCVTTFSGSQLGVGIVGNYALVLLSTAQVAVVNLTTRSYVGYVNVGLTANSPMYLAINGQFAYVSQPSTHKIVNIAFSGPSPYFILQGGYTGSSSFDPSAMTPDHNVVYVSDGDNIDVETLAAGAIEFAPSSEISLGVTAGLSTMSGTGSMLYVQIPGSDQVDAIKLSNDAVTALTTAISAGPLAVSADSGVLALGSANSATLDLDSPVNGSVENSVTTDGTPIAVIDASDVTENFEAFLPIALLNEVAIVDPEAYSMEDVSVGSGADPVAVAVSPDGSYAYVADEGNNTVAVLQNNDIDTPSNMDVASVTLPSGSEPDAIAVDPTGNRLLVADMGMGEVSVIDTNPNDGSSYRTVIYTLYLDGSGTSSSTMKPNAIAFSPDGTYAYVCWRPRCLHMSRQRSVSTTRQASMTMAVLSPRP